MSETCQVCAVALLQKTRGRPRVFCSVACRRLAAFEITRLQRRIERLELEAERIRRDHSGLSRFGSTREQTIADIKTEKLLATERLRELLK